MPSSSATTATSRPPLRVALEPSPSVPARLTIPPSSAPENSPAAANSVQGPP